MKIFSFYISSKTGHFSPFYTSSMNRCFVNHCFDRHKFNLLSFWLRPIVKVVCVLLSVTVHHVVAEADALLNVPQVPLPPNLM